MQETKEKVFNETLTQLVNVNEKEIVVVSSREVAEHFQKQHKHVLESIENITAENPALIGEYFILSTYQSGTGKNYKEYLLTRNGFTLLAMGFTGKEALQWKLKYIEAFNKMEEELKQQSMLTQGLSPQLQLLINMELEQKKIKEQAEHATATAIEAKAEVQAMRDVITLDHKAWRDDIRKIVISIAQKFGGNNYIQDVWKEAYSLLEQRGRTKLDVRLNNRRKNIFAETGSMSKANKYSKLDVIDEEAKLRETFIAIVKEMAIKYGVA